MVKYYDKRRKRFLQDFDVYFKELELDEGDEREFYVIFEGKLIPIGEVFYIDDIEEYPLAEDAIDKFYFKGSYENIEETYKLFISL